MMQNVYITLKLVHPSMLKFVIEFFAEFFLFLILETSIQIGF